MVPWETNDLVVRWFDARTSYLWPAGGGWLVRAADDTPDPALGFWPGAPVVQAPGVLVYEVTEQPAIDLEGEAVDLGGMVTFLGYHHLDAAPDEIALLTAWRVLAPTGRSLKIFVHALDGTGSIQGQWDGLDADPALWRSGDVLVQLHRCQVPDMGALSDLVVGVYDGNTLERFGDQVIPRE
jgi:hypothetical protein